MTAVEDLIATLQVASLIEDRDDNEQRALLRVARRVDRQANANVVGNRWMWGIDAGSDSAERVRDVVQMEQLIDATRLVSSWPGDHQHRVTLPEKKK